MNNFEQPHTDHVSTGASQPEQVSDQTPTLRVSRDVPPASTTPARRVFMPPPSDRTSESVRPAAESAVTDTPSADVTPPMPSDKDRRRITKLAGKLNELQTPNGQAAARKLRTEGTLGTAVLLKGLRDGEVSGSPAIDGLYVCANEAATPLIGKYIQDSAAPSETHHLFNILARVGDDSLLPTLDTYVDAPRPEDNDTHKTIRAESAVTVALGALQRAKTPEERAAWQERIADWTSRTDITGEPYVSPKIIQEGQNTTDEQRALAHANLFFTRHEYAGIPATPEAKKEALSPAERAKTTEDIYDYLAGSVPALADAAPSEVLKQAITTRETTASPYAVTIGIEVEVEEHTILRPDSTDSPDQQAAHHYQNMENFLRTEAAGLPAGEDMTWEFAHRPANDYGTLAREQQIVMAAGLLNPDYQEHPLHITIGNITTEDYSTGNEVSLLARGLEATGWASSAERIRRPLREDNSSWVGPGLMSGIKERARDEIQGSTKTAVELRAFTVRGLGGLTRMLRSAQALGSALSAYQSQENGQQMTSDQHELADTWREYSAAMADTLAAHDMHNPATDPWVNEQWEVVRGAGITRSKVKTMDPDFARMADLLEQAAHDPDSEGAQFQNAVQDHVLRARTRAMRVLSATRVVAQT
jgi:hypothetical protein